MTPIAEGMNLERAYRVLGVTTDASAHAIKQAQRKLVKRWHPDLHKAGTPKYAEATEMSRLINEAFSRISHAPLRYQARPSAAVYQGTPATTEAAGSNRNQTPEKRLPRLDRIEFWVRFVCGACFGAFLSFDLFIGGFTDPFEHGKATVVAVFAALTAGFGLLCAWSGDKFWYTILRLWFEP